MKRVGDSSQAADADLLEVDVRVPVIMVLQTDITPARARPALGLPVVLSRRNRPGRVESVDLDAIQRDQDQIPLQRDLHSIPFTRGLCRAGRRP